MNERYTFRGKRVDTGEWVYGHYCLTRKGDCFIYDRDSGLNEDVILTTVSQCTGLRDKNGKLIFEGDILTTESYPFQDGLGLNYNALVVWIEETAQFGYVMKIVNQYKRGISHDMCEGFDDREIKEWLVIGNRWDNPELLEGGGVVKRTVENCPLIRRTGKMPEQQDGKCDGLANSAYDDEPCDECKACPLITEGGGDG